MLLDHAYIGVALTAAERVPAVFAVIYRKLTATADSFAAEILEFRQMTEQKTARWQSVSGDKAKIV
jgi:hypothetical protein